MHGGPEIVHAEAEHEFEDFFIGLGADASEAVLFEVVLRPLVKRPVFVVDEDAAVFHLRRVDASDAGLAAVDRAGPVDMGFRAVRRDIRPPVPRRHAAILGEFHEAESGRAAVAARDDEGVFAAAERISDAGGQGVFPFSFDLGDIDLFLLDELIDEFAVSERADDDQGFLRAVSEFVLDLGGVLAAGDCLQVGTEYVGGLFHAGVVRVVDEDADLGILVDEREETTVVSFDRHMIHGLCLKVGRCHLDGGAADGRRSGEFSEGTDCHGETPCVSGRAESVWKTRPDWLRLCECVFNFTISRTAAKSRRDDSFPTKYHPDGFRRARKTDYFRKNRK